MSDDYPPLYQRAVFGPVLALLVLLAVAYALIAYFGNKYTRKSIERARKSMECLHLTIAEEMDVCCDKDGP